MCHLFVFGLFVSGFPNSISGAYGVAFFGLPPVGTDGGERNNVNLGPSQSRPARERQGAVGGEQLRLRRSSRVGVHASVLEG